MWNLKSKLPEGPHPREGKSNNNRTSMYIYPSVGVQSCGLLALNKKRTLEIAMDAVPILRNGSDE